MKIYTKKGDNGTTGLIGGTRVPKNSLRIDAYGTVDELNSYMGVLRDYPIDEKYKKQLIEIQDRLFTVGASLASDPTKAKMKIPNLTNVDVEQLEIWIDKMDMELQPMKFFVLPGGHLVVSFTHVARCVCRRAERIITDLKDKEIVAECVLTYMNRLSDYLFVLSRKLSQDFEVQEQPWHPRM
ncbi:MAG: cob(I)yrinic acid a,c-diamide adenosyltransferase [Bacteroidetes bacterium]|nr:cob(I)yrinic acid a,c-diamide adenosyltransferase [Bacteroidota bacterium]